MKGKISIVRNNHDEIKIYIVDETSRTQFLEAQMTPEDLAYALTGRAELPCEFTLRPTNVGKVCQNRTVNVKVEGNSYGKDLDERIEAALAPYEVDGWKGRRDDASNRYKITYREDGCYYADVVFNRFVDAKPANPAP